MKNKNKVLFLGRFPPPIHGASKMNDLYFHGALADSDFSIERIKINKYDILSELGKFTIRKFIGIFSVFFELLKKLLFFRPNLIYFEIAPTGIAFLRDSLYVLLCKLFKKKILFQFRARGIKKTHKKLPRYSKFIFKNAKGIILSELIYTDIEDVIPREKVYILPDGIKDQINSLPERKQNKPVNLLFLSNMIREKGALDVLKICKKLKEDKIKFNCSFVGAIQDKEFFQEFNEEIKKIPECKFLGPKYSSEKDEILKDTDYLLFPTTYPMESFGTVVLEAFMFGVPVFTYNTGSLKGIVKHDFLGFVSKNRDSLELAKKLKERINKEEDRNKIREYFLENYTLGIAEKRLLKIFNKEIER